MCSNSEADVPPAYISISPVGVSMILKFGVAAEMVSVSSGSLLFMITDTMVIESFSASAISMFHKCNLTWTYTHLHTYIPLI